MAECAARRRSSASCLRTRSIAFRMKSDRVQGLPTRARDILRLRSSSIRKQTTRLVFVGGMTVDPFGSIAFADFFFGHPNNREILVPPSELLSNIRRLPQSSFYAADYLALQTRCNA